jgi:hypothetical protein
MMSTLVQWTFVDVNQCHQSPCHPTTCMPLLMTCILVVYPLAQPVVQFQHHFHNILTSRNVALLVLQLPLDTLDL